MKIFLFPYGNSPFEILKNCVKKEFNKEEVNANSYTELKNEIKHAINLKYTNRKAIDEYYLQNLVEKEHQNQYNLVSYFSMKYAAFALMISVFSLIAGYLELPFSTFFVILVWIVWTVIMSYRGVHKQQGQIEYLQFKLRCLEEIVKSETKETDGRKGKKRTSSDKTRS